MLVKFLRKMETAATDRAEGEDACVILIASVQRRRPSPMLFGGLYGMHRYQMFFKDIEPVEADFSWA
jgi:hypothetical protein